MLTSGNTAVNNIILTGNLSANNAALLTSTISTSLTVLGTLRDGLSSVGANNQVLSSNVTGVRWVNLPVYSATSPLLYNSGTGVFSIQQANASQNGYLSSADWITFDGKQTAISLTTTGNSGASTLVGATINVPNYTLSGLGGVPQTRTLTINGVTFNLSADRTWTLATGVSSVSATTPLFSTGGANPDISIQQSSSSLDGYLSSTDWLTFNSKQPAGNYITSLTGEATAAGPGAASVILSNAAVIGKLLTGLSITGSAISSSDSILTAFGKVQNQINGLIGGVQFQGVWNAATNTPALVSSVGTQGYYYIVDVAGNTNLNGITDWQVGDWAIFNGSTWNKVDNTDLVTSVNGQIGAVSLTTDNIPEGATNLYYLDSRARAALSFAAGSGAYNSTTGVITIPTDNSQILNGAGYITLVSLSATSPLTYNNTTGAFAIQVANTTQDGYLSSTDWNTFNGKQPFLGGTGLVKSVAGVISYITDNSANWNTAYNDSIVSAAVTGTATKTLTLNQQDGGTITASWSDIDTGLTSVGVSMPSAFTVTNSPLTSNGTIAITGSGNTLQYVDGTGALQSFPSLTGYVPYTGATANVNLGIYNLTAASLIKNGGTSGQFLKADGSVDSSAYIVLGSLSATAPLSYNNTTGVFTISQSGASTNGYLSSTDWNTFNNKQATITLTTTGSSGASTLIGNTLNIPNYANLVTSVFGRIGAVVATEGDYSLTQLSDVTITTPSSGQVLKYNGTAWVNDIDTDTGITSLNGLTALTQTFAVGTSGTDFAISSVTSTHTFNLPTASVSNRGALSSADWTTFNSKEPAITAGTTLQYYRGDKTFQTLNTTVVPEGTNLYYLDSRARTAISLTTTGSSGASTYNNTTGVFNIPDYGSALSGYVPTSRQLTINGTAYDLSADRSWSVGTVTTVSFTLGASGTDLNSSVVNSTTTPAITLNVPTASAANRGALSAADWSTFNTKVGGVTATTPLFSSGGSTPNLTIQQSSGSQAGYLSSTDWTTFNNKQAAGNYITSLTGEATATGPGAAAVTLDNAAVTGKILTGVNITGGTILSTDSILTGFGKLQNQVNGLIGGSIYQGTWNANTNTPTLTSSVGTAGYYYIVSVAGTTNLNGITDWQVGDWAIFNGGVWQKVDNTDSVTSVNGQTGAVSLTTDNISEGVTNLYYLDSRARAALSFVAGSGAYNSSTGAITIPTNTSQLTNGANFITLASLSGTAPISYNSGTGAISITQAATASNGYLSSTDWNTFNNKQATLSLTTTGTSGAATLVGATLNIPNYGSALTGYVPYTGATGAVTLGAFSLTATGLTVSKSSGISTITFPMGFNDLGYIQHEESTNNIGIMRFSVSDDDSTNDYFVFGNTSAGYVERFRITASGIVNLGTWQGSAIADSYISSAATWNAKQNAITLTTTGTSGAATLVGATLNIPNYGSALTGYVPYTGATANVDLGGFNITAGGTSSFVAATLTSNLWLKNTGSSDFIISNNTSLTTNVVRAYYTTTDELRFYAKNTAGASVVPKIMVGDGTTFTQLQSTITLTTTGTSGAATFSSNTLNIPNYGSALSGYLPLTGGTLTGALNGTSAVFSSTATATAFIPSGATIPTNGMYLSAANTLNFATNTTNRVVIDASGNLGLGVTPSDWISGYNAIQIGNGANFTGYLFNRWDEQEFGLVANGYRSTSGSWLYYKTGFSTRYVQDDGAHIWINAPSGTAGAAITFTQAMTLDASGRLGIGTPTPSQILHLYGSSIRPQIEGTGNGGYSSLRFVGKNSGGTSRTFEVGLNITADDVWQVTNGSSYFLNINTTGAATFSSSLTATGIITANNSGAAESILQSVMSYADGYRATLRLNNTHTGGSIWELYSTNSSDGVYGGGKLGFRNTTTDNYAMTITSTGNVGIGTVSPSTISTYRVLEVTGPNTSTGGMIRTNISDNSIIGKFYTNSTGVWLSAETSHPLILETANTERMRITSVGNFDYGGFNVQSSNNSVYRQAFWGAMSIMWRNAEDFYIDSNHTYSSSNTNVATYTSANGIGRLGIAGGTLDWGSYNGSVTAGTAYALTTRLTIASTGAATFSSSVSMVGLTNTSTSTFSSLATFNGNISLGGNSTYFSSGAVTLGGALSGTSASFSSSVTATGYTFTGSGAVLQSSGSVGNVPQYGLFYNSGGVFYFGKDDGSGGSFGVGAYASVLWNSGAYPIVFATGNAEKMRITSGGSLSINYSAGPVDSGNQKLHVYGGIRQDVIGSSYGEGILINFPTGGTDYGGLFMHSTTANSAVGAGTIKWQMTYNYVPETGVGAGGLAFTTTNINTRLLLTSGGNVIIGTTDTSTGHRLTVYSATETAQFRAAGAAPAIIFTNTATNTNSYVGYLGMATAVNNFVTGAAAGDFVLHNYSGGPILFGINNSEKMRIATTGNVGIGTSSPTAKLDVNGEIRMTGSTLFRGMSSNTLQLCGGTSSSNVKIDGSIEVITMDANGATRLTIASSGVITLSNLAGTGSRAVLADASGNLSAPVSDISVKQNIKPIGYGLNEIVKMNPVWFDFIDGYKNFGEGRQNGNIAQEMEVIIPEAVFTTPSTGKMGINYDQLHAVYIKAIQELKAEIEELKLKIK